MKKLLLTILLASKISYSQTYFSAGFDFRNAVVGSDPTNNKPAFDGLFRFGCIGSVPNHDTKIEVSVGYETFKRIQFDRYLCAVGVNFDLTDKITIIPSWEGSIIGRWGQTWQNNNSHISVLSGTLAVRYKLNDKFSVESLTGALSRVDLNTRYGGDQYRINQYFSLIYRP